MVKAQFPKRPPFEMIRAANTHSADNMFADNLELQYDIAHNLAIIAAMGLAGLNPEQLTKVESFLSTHNSTIGEGYSGMRATVKPRYAAADAKTGKQLAPVGPNLAKLHQEAADHTEDDPEETI